MVLRFFRSHTLTTPVSVHVARMWGTLGFHARLVIPGKVPCAAPPWQVDTCKSQRGHSIEAWTNPSVQKYLVSLPYKEGVTTQLYEILVLDDSAASADQSY